MRRQAAESNAMRSSTLLVLLLAVVVGCTSTPPSTTSSSPAPTPAPAPDQRAATPAHLAAERQWLSSWFKGTPVKIRQVDENAIAIDVPREFCFDQGASKVKPALGAVLDKMTQSLQRVPIAQVTLIAAPADAQANNELALKRAAQVQQHLRNAGVRADRLGKPSVASGPVVQLRMEASSL
jgi:outer membrane protein OmpA-like peptidoglycan-associated protein